MASWLGRWMAARRVTATARFKLGEEITAPYNAPAPGQVPTMDGYVTDYISCFTAEMGRQTI